MTERMIKLTSDDRKGIALAAKEELARRNYGYYFMLANSSQKAKMYPHTKYLCDKLQKIIDGEQHFYIVEMPPQHGKSMTITETFPSYYLIKNPDKDVMITAYAYSLSSKFANKDRRHFQFWGPRLAGLTIGKNTANEFDIMDHKGSFYATSILGAGTGRSADLLIIDDPIENAQSALSKIVKDSIWSEWTDTFSTRLQKGGSVIVIMTRWQTDDLAGRLLKMSTYPWEEIKFPAIAENIPEGKTDMIGRHNGEALCPELHPLKSLLAHKRNMGTHRFTALYQQSPTVNGGTVFKNSWVRYYVPSREVQVELGLTDKDAIVAPRRGHYDSVAQSWDLTFKDQDTDDFVAGQVWAKRKARYFLMPKFVHARLGFVDTVKAIKALSKEYPEATSVYIEDKANGPAVIDSLKDQIAGIIPVEPQGGKVARAAAVTSLWEAGDVFVPHPLWQPKINDWLEEILGFPAMPHDDNVDAMTQGLTYMRQHSEHINRFMDFQA